MFKSIAVAFALATSVASASTYVTDLPQIWFGTTAVRADQVCVNGDMLQTINAVTTCAAGDMNGYDNTCVSYETNVLSTPVTFSRAKCENYGMEVRCGEETEVVSIPLSYNVNVYLAGDGFDPAAYGPFQYSYTHTVPACN